jgi:hypothetical protein
MNHSAIPGIHRIERDRSSCIPCPFHRAIGETAKSLLSLIAAAFDIDHDPRCIFALSHRDLICHELQRIGCPPIASLKRFGGSPAELKNQVIAFG